MPFRTKYGSHYHMTEGCHGATIPCGTEGLTPCSDCCGNGGGEGGTGQSTAIGAGSPVGGAAGAEFSHVEEPDDGIIAVDGEIIGVSDVRLGGVAGTLYKLDKMLDPEVRREISALDGVSTVITVAQYAPEMKRTAIFVEDGMSYTIRHADDVMERGMAMMADPVAAPSGPSPSAPAPSPVDDTRDDDDLPTIDGVDPSDSRELTVAAWREWDAGREAREDAKAYVERQRTENEILGRLRSTMRTDPDVSGDAGMVAEQLHALLSVCDVRPLRKGQRGDSYTDALVGQYVVFAGSLGGSEADYCASHARDALAGYQLRLHDDADADEVLARIRAGMDDTALYPDREYGVLSQAGIPVYRSTYLDDETKGQREAGNELRGMDEHERRAMWAAEANEWAGRWAATREIRGEGRDAELTLASYPDFASMKADTLRMSSGTCTARGHALDRKYGSAYTREMEAERAQAYSTAASNAMRRLSSRQQEARKQARLRSEAERVVASTRDYDESTPLSQLQPEERRQLARRLVQEADHGRGTRETRMAVDHVLEMLDSGTVGDIRIITDKDPVSIVDEAAADAMVALRARGQASHRTARRDGTSS